MRVLRVYADTSVFGGCFDEEFAEASNRFFDRVRSGDYHLVVSETTFRELQRAPSEVREVLARIPAEKVETTATSDELIELRDAYVAEGVVGSASLLDAEHMAAAAVADVDLVVSARK